MQEIGKTGTWPPNELETIGKCPICGGKKRKVLYKGLKDRVFFCAPGEWILYRCEDCGSGYIDPRPTLESIGKAYSNYFTHNKEDTTSASYAIKLRRALANGYRNYKYGTTEKPSWSLGILLAWLFPNHRAVADASMRYIPRAEPGARLLDVGCGSGYFLARAKNAGWTVVGIDPDSRAVEVSQERGLDVRKGNINVLQKEHEKFNGITLSHVIEHVHNPEELLQACYQLLKPGGWIWVETPNIESKGHAIFGKEWLDLDPPRHLSVFNNNSLLNIISKAGFNKTETMPWRPLCRHVFAASSAISRNRDPVNEPGLTIYERWLAIAAEMKAKKNPGIREYLSVRAWKEK